MKVVAAWYFAHFGLGRRSLLSFFSLSPQELDLQLLHFLSLLAQNFRRDLRVVIVHPAQVFVDRRQRVLVNKVPTALLDDRVGVKVVAIELLQANELLNVDDLLCIYWSASVHGPGEALVSGGHEVAMAAILLEMVLAPFGVQKLQN